MDFTDNLSYQDANDSQNLTSDEDKSFENTNRITINGKEYMSMDVRRCIPDSEAKSFICKLKYPLTPS